MRARSPKISPAEWSEAPAWASIAQGWRPLGGSFRGEGFSLEWHELKPDHRVNWTETVHPHSVEICLNLQGRAEVGAGDDRIQFDERSVAFYVRGADPIPARRITGESHEFLTLELSFGFLRTHIAPRTNGLHQLVDRVVSGEDQVSGAGKPRPITTRQEALVKSLQDPPVFAAARDLWFRGKAFELMSETLFQPGDRELFCSRQKRVSRERVERAMGVLRENMEEPPSLEDLGRSVGCSPYYLSRTFSQETGMTIPQFLRRIRLERAAELLRSGRFNVTEAAMEVGYNSLSHFSAAFHEMFGCCPGLYPLPVKSDGSNTHQTRPQRAGRVSQVTDRP